MTMYYRTMRNFHTFALPHSLGGDTELIDRDCDITVCVLVVICHNVTIDIDNPNRLTAWLFSHLFLLAYLSCMWLVLGITHLDLDMGTTSFKWYRPLHSHTVSKDLSFIPLPLCLFCRDEQNIHLINESMSFRLSWDGINALPDSCIPLHAI
jgi:hypothetical protein